MAIEKNDLPRVTLGVIVIVLLIVGCLWILQPFIVPAIWAAMLVVSTWPLMLRLERRFKGRRWLATTVMTLILVLLVVLALLTIVSNADRAMEGITTLSKWRPPAEAPAWLSGLPVVGAQIARLWKQGLEMGLGGLLPSIQPYAGNLTHWVLAQLGGIGMLLLQFLITTCLMVVMYVSGESWADTLRSFARRLGGAQGEAAVVLAGTAIRGVALGVGVTALLQAVLAGVGMAVAGVPMAGLLTIVVFALCIAQVGPLPVMLPAAVWLITRDAVGWGSALVVWSLFVATFDSVVRPFLIRKGANLPLLLIFAGVIGGLLAFGLIGVFAGPVVLAVAYTLLRAWVDDGSLASAAAVATNRPIVPDTIIGAHVEPAQPTPSTPAETMQPVQGRQNVTSPAVE